MKEEKSVYEMVLEIAKAANDAEEEDRNRELYEKKEEPIKKINETKPHRNYSLEAYRDYFTKEKGEDEE